MSTPVLSQKDFNWIELLKVRAQNLASAPATPQPGWIYYDTTLNKLRVCTNATGPVWVNLDGSDIPDSTVTSAKIADGAIMNIDINGSAAIALSKLATDPLARANHTGTQLASTVSDFNTAVRTNRLDQMAAPTAAVAMGSQAITGLADPTNPQDASTKNYVDLARQGIRLKDSVKVASTAALTLSGTQTIDGIAVIAGDRVLAKDQAGHTADGIYVVAAGAWTRATDADTAAELVDGATVWVNQGTVNGNTTWSQINTITTLGTDAQSWVQQGSATSYTWGNGIDATGNTVDVVAGNGIISDATNLRVDPAVVARKYSVLLSTSATSYVVNHGLANQWVTVQVYEATGSFRQVDVDVELTDANNATVKFTTAPSANAYRVVVTG